jgi:hypothetical protein
LTAVVIVLVLAPILCCAGSQYVDDHLSARAYLDGLAGVSAREVTLSGVRTRLLQRLPRGTPAADIYAFLEAHGVERDRFVGGQWMRYQPKNDTNAILGLLSDPPYRLMLFCSGGGYIIRFQLDAQDRLDDILIESTAVCL